MSRVYDWMSPLNKVSWRNAFLKGAKQVTLHDERKFNIDYRQHKGVDVAYVWPVGEDFVPCGYINMEKAKDELWLVTDFDQAHPGLYVRILDRFLESADLGVNVVEEYQELHGRHLQAIRRGLSMAKTGRGIKAEHIRIVLDEGQLFLLKGDTEDG